MRENLVWHSSWVESLSPKGLILSSPYMLTLLEMILLLFILKIRCLARKRYKQTHKNVVLLAEVLESKIKAGIVGEVQAWLSQVHCTPVS